MWVERSPEVSPAPASGADGGAAPLFVVINPGSGAHDAVQTREVLSRVFDEARRPAWFADLASPSRVAWACGEAAAKAQKAGGILVAAGGDGTLNAAAQAAMAHGCPLGVIPQGTFNLMARDNGIPEDTEAAARALLRASPRPVQAGVVNGQLFLVNASVGLYPQLLQDRESFNARFGRQRWGALVSGLVTLFKWRRQLVLDIVLDGRHTTLVTPTLFVANNRLQMERLGIEEQVAAQVGENRLAGVAPRPIGSWAMLGLVLHGALGRLGEADNVQSFSFHRLDVKLRRRMRSVKVSTDGEVRAMAPPLCFMVSPQPLMLMAPAAGEEAARE